MNKHPLFIVAALLVIAGVTSPAFAETTGHYIDDATITAKVKEAILADKQLSVLQVSVATDHGTVTLSGTVDSKTESDAAGRDAKLVDGAAWVTNSLSIKTSPVVN